MEKDWIPNGDGTYTAEKGDSAGTLARDAGIDFNRANELVELQLGDNYTGADGGIKSDVEVGDVVTVPEQVPIELEEALITGMGSEKIASLQKEIKTLDSVIDVSKEKIDLNKKANEISGKQRLDKPMGGDPTTGTSIGESFNRMRRSRNIRENEEKVKKSTKSRDSIINLMPKKGRTYEIH